MSVAAAAPLVVLTLDTGTAVAGVLAVALAAGVVYRDAARIGVDAGSPMLWAGLVAGTAGAGGATALAVPDAPLPGVLVLVALGPLLYALEREDSLHGEATADPTRLPSATPDETVEDSGDGTAGEER